MVLIAYWYTYGIRIYNPIDIHAIRKSTRMHTFCDPSGCVRWSGHTPMTHSILIGFDWHPLAAPAVSH